MARTKWYKLLEKNYKRNTNTVQLLTKVRFYERNTNQSDAKRRLFQITRTRTQYEKNTQIYAEVHCKNHVFNCIFMISNHATMILLKNNQTTIIQN